MADEEIDRLTVKLEADYSKFTSDVNKAIDDAAKRLKTLEKAEEDAQKKTNSLADSFGQKLVGAVSAFGTAMAAAFSANAIGAFFSNLIKGSVEASASFETFTVQFETLLGSTSAAKQRIDELAQFGQTTPFELPEIVEANRLLQTFGGTALATGENLRRIGDSAAAVNAPFKEVAFWTGRMYAAIQSGRPFGEASARLQELGILTGDVRTKLEDMQKSGADGTAIWAAYSEMIDTRFTGAMDRLSKTFQGVMSNIADFQGMLLREGGASLFEGLREDAIEFYDIINQPEVKDALIDLADSFGGIADTLREAITSPLLEGLQNVEPEELRQLASSLDDFGTAVGNLLSGGADINSLVTALTVLTDSMTTFVNMLNRAVPLIESGGQALVGFLAPVTNLWNGFVKLNEAVAQFTGFDLSDVTRGFVNTFQDADDSLQNVSSATAGFAEELDGMAAMGQAAVDANKELAESSDDAAKGMEEMRKAADKAAGSLLDLQDSQAEKRQELEADHTEKMAQIEEDYQDKKADIIKNRSEAILELDKNTAKQRAKIIEDTQEALAKLDAETVEKRNDINKNAEKQLADLSEDTEKEIAKLKQKAREKEKQETKAHKDEMKQLEDQYLYDLEGAVAARDARAIVDLRRKYQMEKREKEKEFEDRQESGGGDLEAQIEEIRARERERRDEIRQTQQEELAQFKQQQQEKRDTIARNSADELIQLAENEAEKRAQIDASFAEQMAKADESHAEAMSKEGERYAERQTALDEAMQKRLETIAKELADEKEIDEKGAKAILKALDKTFGIGGDIDELMDDFADRRRQKLVVQMGFEANLEGGPDDTSYFGTPGQRGNMGGPMGLPGFAEGGIVPGPIGQPILAKLHGGEMVVPFDQLNLGGGEKRMRVELDISGSAPPGIGNNELNKMAGMMVRALREAGIDAR